MHSTYTTLDPFLEPGNIWLKAYRAAIVEPGGVNLWASCMQAAPNEKGKSSRLFHALGNPLRRYRTQDQPKYDRVHRANLTTVLLPFSSLLEP